MCICPTPVPARRWDSEWFNRGWTLQGLIAPKSLDFYTQAWQYRGNRDNLQEQICRRTNIPGKALGGDLSRFSRDERMRWLGDRKTTQ